MAAKPKMRFAPLPLRALCDPDLSAIDLRILACVAWHDRLSLAREDGQGCWASYETIAGEVRCHPTNASSSLAKLVRLEYLDKKPRPIDRRQHVYRVIYDEGEALSFGKASFRGVSEAETDPCQSGTPDKSAGVVCQSANEGGEILCPGNSENGGRLLETMPEYISLSDGIDFDKSRERNSSKEAQLTLRDDFTALCSSDGEGVSNALGLGEEEHGPSVGGEMARFERAFKEHQFWDDPASLLGWVKWLEAAQEAYCGEPLGYQAQRLCEDAINALPEDVFRQWQADDSPRTVLPVEAMVGEPDAIRLQVAAYYEQADKRLRESIARRAGLPLADLRGFVQGRVPLPIGKQMALRTAMREAA